MGSSAAEDLLIYPDVRRDESVADNYHGVIIPDPYRWLEDPDAQEVKDFVEKQVKLTQSYLQNCETREKFKGYIIALLNHPRYHIPLKYGDEYFYFSICSGMMIKFEEQLDINDYKSTNIFDEVKNLTIGSGNA